MARYILGRLFGIVVVMVIVSIVIFGLMHAIPGGPFDEAKMPLPPEAKANILRKYGLDKPLYEQYGRYVWAALHGDFGTPFQSPTETVTGLIARTWPVSLKLGLVTLAFALPLGLMAGVLAGSLIYGPLGESAGYQVPLIVSGLIMIALAFFPNLHRGASGLGGKAS